MLEMIGRMFIFFAKGAMSLATMIVNGVSHEVSNSISNVQVKGDCIMGDNKVIVNGLDVTKTVKIEWHGDAVNLDCVNAIINGDVKGNVSGVDITCGDVNGKVDGTQINCGNVGKGVNGMDINCGNVGGNVDGMTIKMRK